MSCQSKATQISLLLHVALAFGILLVSRYAIPETPPLVIDFSIATAEAATSAPPAQIQPVVPPKEPPKSAIKQPQKHKKIAVPRPKTAREAAKRAAAPTVQPTQEPAPVPVVDDQPVASSADLQAGASRGDPDAATATASGQAAAGNQAESAHQGGKQGSGTGGGGKASFNFEYIRRLILNNLSFPATARKMGLTGKIVVSFLLREDGQVEDIAIVSGSGHEILDNNVVATIRRIAPFPRPPARAQLVLPIVFNLK